MRRSLLTVLLCSELPQTAYQLIPLLERELDRRFAPPSIYRTLAFLVSQHLAARIESLNAYVACANPSRPHACMFFVCDLCGGVEEIEDPAIEARISYDANLHGFHAARQIVELEGVCGKCRAAAGRRSVRTS